MSGRDDDVNVVIHVCVLKLNCYRNKCCSLLGIVIVMNITLIFTTITITILCY